MNYYLFIAIFILSSYEAAAATSPLIVGGQSVGASDPIAAATVGIFSPSPDGHSGSLCTGTLIGEKTAVTAAHCLEDGSPTQKPVMIFGSDLHAPNPIRRPITASIINPKYENHAGRGMDQGDIAIVRIGGTLPEGYHPMPMAKTDNEISSGEKVTLAGYGISNAARKSGAGRLRKTNVEVLNNRAGKSEMILDQSHGHGACHGDSGGPAFIRENGRIEVAGVTNRSYPNSAPDDCRHQVVYTKIPAYKKWIATNSRRLARQDNRVSPSLTPQFKTLKYRMSRHGLANGRAIGHRRRYSERTG